MQAVGKRRARNNRRLGIQPRQRLESTGTNQVPVVKYRGRIVGKYTLDTGVSNIPRMRPQPVIVREPAQWIAVGSIGEDVASLWVADPDALPRPICGTLSGMRVALTEEMNLADFDAAFAESVPHIGLGETAPPKMDKDATSQANVSVMGAMISFDSVADSPKAGSHVAQMVDAIERVMVPDESSSATGLFARVGTLNLSHHELLFDSPTTDEYLAFWEQHSQPAAIRSADSFMGIPSEKTGEGTSSVNMAATSAMLKARVHPLDHAVWEFISGHDGEAPDSDTARMANRIVDAANWYTKEAHISYDEEEGYLDFHLRLGNGLLVMASIFIDGTIDASVYDDGQAPPVRVVRRMRRGDTNGEDLIELFWSGFGVGPPLKIMCAVS